MPVGNQFYIKEGMLSKELKNIDSKKDGNIDYFYFSIWNQKLHAKEPLGNIRKFTLKIDGEKIENKRIFFVLREQWICIEKIHTISDIWWMLREEAQIYIKKDGGIDSGIHNVECIIEDQVYPFYSKGIRPSPALNLKSEMITI